MPPRKPSPPPMFFEAAEDLYIYNPDAGVVPAAAYRAGDQVAADVVAAHGWEDRVRAPVTVPPEAATAAGKE